MASCVFFVSRLLPGDSASEYILQEEGGLYGTSSTQARLKAYRQYLSRTGQDKPLFYFSVRSVVEPDTLHLVYPEAERELVKKIAWHYGHWPSVATYYQKLQMLNKSLTPEERRLVQPDLEMLYTQVKSANITPALKNVEIKASSPCTLTAVKELRSSLHLLMLNQAELAYLLPHITWHGTGNQYHNWFKQLLKGDFGVSERDGRPVLEVLSNYTSNTFFIVLLSMVIAAFAALKLSILMLRQERGTLHRYLSTVLILINSIPTFVLALVLLVLFASPSFLQVFPVYGLGYYSGSETEMGIANLLYQMPYMVLPVCCLVLANLPYLVNQFYRALADSAQSDYARTARAKGLDKRQVIRQHILRNALLPIITLLADFIPALFAGAVIIETIFAIPGIGTLLVKSVLARDHAVIVAIILAVAVLKVVAHFVADIFYTLADPRIRFQNS
ncbi:ABC transporter permease [Pontibacter sp. SGAir0037]|uniref:ABC transporter permease n=1 Tax=Pontibacter sp. SGAir0037 TaxID=2571030 RepID=UPI00143CDB84|nr:ABC transporter permease [Pontibacter sp. SGAir0037]